MNLITHNDCIAVRALTDPDIDPGNWREELPEFLGGLRTWSWEVSEAGLALPSYMRKRKVYAPAVTSLGRAGEHLRAANQDYARAKQQVFDWIREMQAPFANMGG